MFACVMCHVNTDLAASRARLTPQKLPPKLSVSNIHNNATVQIIRDYH